ncbi:MAG: hypothetical protein Hens3KO_27960 [Henriciella sp.]
MTAIDKLSPISVTSSKKALRAYATRIDYNPQTNSVFAYANELFQRLETGETDLSQLEELVADVYSVLTDERAIQFRDQHQLENGETWIALEKRLGEIAGLGWPAFRKALETPKGGVVFTAHPTFAMSKSARAKFADVITAPTKANKSSLKKSLQEDGRDWSQSISLQGEHEEAQAAIAHAQHALNLYAKLVYKTARAAFPDKWQTLKAQMPTIASWIGYDLDGRTDIDWSQSFALRLGEKTEQLKRYRTRVEALADLADGKAKKALQALAETLVAATNSSAEKAAIFSNDLTEPDNLVTAANALTAEDPARITSAKVITDALKKVLKTPGLSPDLAEQILVFQAEVQTLQLGTARIHLRLNAAQIGTVISRDLGLETENRDLGRSALHQLSKLAKTAKVLPVNFADLFLEQSTARRQFMMCAQFLKHIDKDSTIRFLIAETENPATVMGSLYLARLYGVDHQLDISPLFETPEALETGGRFMEQLLEEPEYIAYLKKRGYVSIQLGFSDAGRFIGQVSADMAIERIHNLICRAVANTGEDLSLLIFNTHGESMGRGAWPGTFSQRFDHLLTHWVRGEARRRKVPLRHEVSFQGGDGYLHFANPELAGSTYAAFAKHLLSDPSEKTKTDPFYQKTDLVWDFYRALRSWHERLFANEDYGHLLSDFATNFLVKAGSRQRRRTGGPTGPRALRAISHNATLQQVGVPLNTAAGIGSALRRERDQVQELINTSPRMRGLMKLASIARLKTSVPVLRAYASVYDPSYWVALARADGGEASLAYRRIYYLLQDRQTSTSIEKIANSLSIDFSKFDMLLKDMDQVPSPPERREARLDLHILHAVRQALMMKALALAGRLPTVSRRHASSVVDIMHLIESMQLGEAVEILCDIFPASLDHEEGLKNIKEPGHMTGNPANGYDQLHQEIIGPLDRIDRQLHTITLAIAQAYGAYG